MTLVWPNGYPGQRLEVVDLLHRIENLDRQISPATWISTIKPTVTDMENTWSTKKGQTLTVPNNSRTMWWNPDTEIIENIFVSLPEDFADPIGLHADDGADQVVLLDEFFMNDGDPDVTFWDATIDTKYERIRVLMRSRLSLDNFYVYLAVENNITAIYYYANYLLDNTPQLVRENQNAITVLNATNYAPGEPLSPTGAYAYAVYDFEFPGEINSRSGFFESQYFRAAGTTAAYRGSRRGGFHAFFLTSWTFLRFAALSGTFAKGTRFVVYGINPITQ